MSFIYDTAASYDICPSSTTFLPCCNAPMAVDGLYQARHFQEIYYAPEPPPQIQVVRQRLPDPAPDVIERVVVVPQPKKYIYQVVEVPTKPPPVIQQRVVHEPPNQPLCGGTYRVQVPSNATVRPQRLAQSTSNVQLSPTFVQASPSYIQQASPSYIQQAPTMYQSGPVISM